MASISAHWSEITNGKYPLRLIDNGDGSYSLDTTGSGGSPAVFAQQTFTADGSGEYVLDDTPDAGTVMMFVGGGQDTHFTVLGDTVTEDSPSVAGVIVVITYFH